ncbi:MAG: ABC transporter ATP-binding protein/permease [Opitutales bacterium]|nr:ABC transporter ATP-binding protein/permease [Opitutales bacterium]
MLRSQNLSVVTPDGNEILKKATVSFAPQKMHALIGPSGCGKTTLMKAILGMIDHSGGTSFLDDFEIKASDELAGAIGFVPQFTLAYENLTVRESLEYILKIGGVPAAKAKTRLQSVLKVVKLTDRAGTRIAALSGGQLRRLGLAMELVLSPSYLVCDEVTSGLDPNSENEMLALMRELVQNEGKAIVCIIHNLTQLDKFDTVTVVLKGRVVFQGSPQELLKYFSIQNYLQLYSVLNSQEIDFWTNLYEKFQRERNLNGKDQSLPSQTGKSALSPSIGTQLLSLLSRRTKLFFRDKGYLSLTLAITFGFPCIVALFAMNGLPSIEQLPLNHSGTFSISAVNEAIRIKLSNSQVATLATGLVLFQVILLALMGANNGGREIAGERSLYEKERMLGLNPVAYAFSKLIFTSVIAIFQGVWMCGFVKTICIFPGSWAEQLSIMAGVCLAMTLICLGFSSLMKSAEKASLLTIYLVGFQLPLSGIVLELPDALVWVFRPFVNAFWGWSGFFDAMNDSQIYDAYTSMNPNADIFTFSTSFIVLLIQALAGTLMLLAGCIRRQKN